LDSIQNFTKNKLKHADNQPEPAALSPRTMMMMQLQGVAKKNLKHVNEDMKVKIHTEENELLARVVKFRIRRIHEN